MTTNPIRQCVGIDISKDEFVASLATLNEAFQVSIISTKAFDNTLAGFLKMDRWANQLATSKIPLQYVMEATARAAPRSLLRIAGLLAL